LGNRLPVCIIKLARIIHIRFYVPTCATIISLEGEGVQEHKGQFLRAAMPQLQLQPCDPLIVILPIRKKPDVGDNRRIINLIDKRPAYCESGSSPTLGKVLLFKPN
jgi:hypothetical protein